MSYLTDEQREFDDLIKQINEDAILFKKPEATFKRLLQFNNGLDGTILINTDNRIITFGNADKGFTMLDADYVVDHQEFYDNLEVFNQFYQKEKAAAQKFTNFLNALELPVAPEVMPPKPEEFLEVKIEAEPYSEAWLKNPENATWELHWDSGIRKTHEQYLSKDLYRIHGGEFVLHEKHVNNQEVVQRNLSIEAVKTFVRDWFLDYEDTLSKIGIETDGDDRSLELSTSLPPQDQLINKVQHEYESFKDGMKQLSKDDMMRAENAYEMMVKYEIVDHIVEENIPDELATVLLESDNTLDDIYDEYTTKDSHTFFEPIQAAIDDYVAKHRGVITETLPALTPQLFNRNTITPTNFISPIPGNDDFNYTQYEFESDDDLREKWEAFGEEINTSTYRIQYDHVLEQIAIMEASSEDFYVSENATALFDVADVVAYCEELYDAGELANYTEDFKNFLKEEMEQESNSAMQYVEVKEANNGFVSAEELDADGVKNMIKHKGRTNIKDFGYKGLE